MGNLPEPSFTHVTRYLRSIPQPTLGHAERLQRVATHLKRTPGLHLIGSGVDGVGIPDCIRQARSLVERWVQVE
jgi:oxygen-dependent protoporphyrinogen oxidase